MSRFLLLILVSALGLGSCQRSDVEDESADIDVSAGPADASPVASSGSRSAQRPKLHPLESYCLTFVLEGMLQGTWEECSKDYGYSRYEVQNTEIKMGGFSQKDEKRVVYEEDYVYTIMPDGTATRVKNPMFASTVEAMKARDPKDIQLAFVRGLGFELTADTMDVAGHRCRVATGPMGSMCITEDALVLHMDTMGQVRRATQVRIGESGDPANYAVPANVTEGPSMENLQDMLEGLGAPPEQ